MQQVVWRLADRDPDALADLAVDDENAAATARHWVDAFGVAARGEVTADFYDEGSTRQTVVLYFADARRTKEITARIGDDDTWGVVLDEPDAKEATAQPTWAPRKPGGTGSHSTGG